MQSFKSPFLPGALLLVLVFSLLDGCAGNKRREEPPNPSVASVSPPQGKPIQPPPEPPKVELFYGEGDCAPRFANGRRGTCINNQPCNGFGVKDASGKLECDCFGKRGGCEEGLVCSVRRRACVEPRDDDK
jgi:hypothetical protein